MTAEMRPPERGGQARRRNQGCGSEAGPRRGAKGRDDQAEAAGQRHNGGSEAREPRLWGRGAAAVPMRRGRDGRPKARGGSEAGEAKRREQGGGSSGGSGDDSRESAARPARTTWLQSADAFEAISSQSSSMTGCTPASGSVSAQMGISCNVAGHSRHVVRATGLHEEP